MFPDIYIYICLCTHLDLGIIALVGQKPVAGK